MNLEKRLQSAAAETNEVARNTVPRGFGAEPSTIRPWLAFAAAFAVVVAVIGIPWALGNLTQAPANDIFVGAGDTSTTLCLQPDTTTTVVVPSELGGESAANAEFSSEIALQDNIDIVAFLNDEGPEGVAAGGHLEFLAEVESWIEVASAIYVDKDETWIEYQQIFEGQDELLEVDPTILPATIRIELVDSDTQRLVKERLEQQTPEVKSVAARDDETQASDCPATTVTTLASTSTAPSPECELSDLYPPTTLAYTDDDSDPRNLTEPVKDKLTRIAEAASLCDASALSALADPDITTTFGAGGGPEDLASWEGDDERFEILATLLNMSHGVTEMEDGSRIFVWPAAFEYDSWDDIPADLMDQLLSLYSQEELDQISLLGSYGGWRIGITESGDWIFFVAGD